MQHLVDTGFYEFSFRRFAAGIPYACAERARRRHKTRPRTTRARTAPSRRTFKSCRPSTVRIYNQNALILLLRRDLVRQDRVERRLAVRDLGEVDDESFKSRLLRDQGAQRRVDAPPLA